METFPNPVKAAAQTVAVPLSFVTTIYHFTSPVDVNIARNGAVASHGYCCGGAVTLLG
jgi:hypothetical protein